MLNEMNGMLNDVTNGHHMMIIEILIYATIMYNLVMNLALSYHNKNKSIFIRINTRYSWSINIYRFIWLLFTSDSRWPADSFNGEESYARLFSRLGWHAAGPSRTFGTGGESICYPPESSWMDNANLDYACALVGRIKERYGDFIIMGWFICICC